MGSLSEKVALVTGGGKGIGRATAELLAAEGAAVVIVARTASDLDEVEAAIRSSGGEALSVAGDLTDESFVEQLFGAVRAKFGRLDILVNNAGVAPFGPLETMPAADVRRCLELNVTAAFNCMQKAVVLMKENGDTGKIINVGSVCSHWTGGGGAGAYAASKYGLRALTEAAARQLHGSGSNIAVGLVCPGIVNTTLTNPGGEAKPDWLRPEDIAHAVLYAVSTPPGVNVYDLTLFPTSQAPW